MIKHKLYIALILISLFSCKPKNNDSDDNLNSTVEQQEDVIVSRIGISLTPKAKEGVNLWFEYQMIQSKIEAYNKITIDQALENAKSLSDLIKKTDTIKVDILDRPDVKVRFNVLYNHAMRLDDMSTISSISDEEVMDEITRILDAFSAVNDKINVIYTIEELEEELDIEAIGMVEFINHDTLPEPSSYQKRREIRDARRIENSKRRERLNSKSEKQN